MSRLVPRWSCLAISMAIALLVVAGVFAQDQDPGKKKSGRPDRKSPAPVASDRERASGVIVKSESIGKGANSRSDDVAGEKGRSATHRLTINTAAVWRDWARDQAGQDVNASPRDQAKRGNNSVATKGEPQSEDTLVVIDVGPSSKVQTRFRASNDETSKGSKTPAEAREANEDPATENGKGKGNSSTGEMKGSKVTRFQSDDLQPGLFVEIDFVHKDARNLASTVAVIRPIGGPDDPSADSSAGKSKSKTKGKEKAKN